MQRGRWQRPSKSMDGWMFSCAMRARAILPLARATADQIMGILAVNVLGPSLLAVAALPHLQATMGTIVNVSSTFGHTPAA